MDREFTVATGYKIFYGIIALALTGAGFYLFTLPNHGNNVVLLMPLLLFVMALAIILPQFKRKLIVTETRITSVNLFKTTEIAIGDIKGFRFGPKGKSLFIESLSSAPKLTIANYSDFAGSDDFKNWLTTNFINLDDTEYQDTLNHILNDSSLGVTAEDRQAQLDKAKYISWVYNGGGVALFFINLFVPDKEAIIAPLILIYPLLSLLVVLMSKGLIKIVDNKKSPYPHILFGILASLIAQLIGIGHNHILSYDNFWLPFALMALVLIAVFYYVDRINNLSPVNGQIFILLLFGGLYGFGGVQQINRIFDKSTPQIYHAVILSEYVSHGKNTSYNLHLSSWGPQVNEETVSVSQAFYNQTAVGTTVNITLKNGFFNIPWFTVSN